jgi:hypothetical protein
LINTLENVFDPLHTHFVHTLLVRTHSQRKPVEAEVRRLPDRLEVEYHEGKQSGLISQLFGAAADTTISRFLPPSIAQLEYRNRGAVKLILTLLMTPEDERTVRIHAVATGTAAPIPGRLASLVLKPLFLLAAYQDQKMMAKQSRNIAKFGGREYFTNTELDLVRRHLLQMVKGADKRDGVEPYEQRVTLTL